MTTGTAGRRLFFFPPFFDGFDVAVDDDDEGLLYPVDETAKCPSRVSSTTIVSAFDMTTRPRFDGLANGVCARCVLGTTWNHFKNSIVKLILFLVNKMIQTGLVILSSQFALMWYVLNKCEPILVSCDWPVRPLNMPLIFLAHLFSSMIGRDRAVASAVAWLQDAALPLRCQPLVTLSHAPLAPPPDKKKLHKFCQLIHRKYCRCIGSWVRSIVWPHANVCI